MQSFRRERAVNSSLGVESGLEAEIILRLIKVMSEQSPLGSSEEGQERKGREDGKNYSYQYEGTDV